MHKALVDYYRCRESHLPSEIAGEPGGDPGYFRIGTELICFGRSTLKRQLASQQGDLPDVADLMEVRDNGIFLPFDLDEIVSNLRFETYAGNMGEERTRLGADPTVRKLYYWLRPILPVRVRRILQGFKLRGNLNRLFPRWPVDRTVDQLIEKTLTMALRANGNRAIPFIWFWPERKNAAFILTHDVEEEAGRDFCSSLMDIDDEYGFKSSFQVVPEKRYSVHPPFLDGIAKRGFEVCVHDFNHDGNLYKERTEFRRRAKLINGYARQFGASGFRSGVLYRNLRWYGDYEFSYDMSVPNVAHLDPQGGGCCTVMPYFVGDILEIPVTATQDYSLFHIFNQYSIDLWKQQIETIVAGHGLASFIIHPDYVVQAKPQRIYRELLTYVREQCRQRNIWDTLPGEINTWWRQRRAMQLVEKGESWGITGDGKERARVAYASLQNGSLVYGFEKPFENSRPIELAQALRYVPKIVHPPIAPDQISGESAVATASVGSNRSTVMLESTSEATRPSATPDETLGKVNPRSGIAHQPLRIAMVSYSFFEGDNRVLRYATTLAKRGDYVDVFSLRRGSNPVEELFEGVHVHRLQDRVRDEKNQLSYGSRILQFLFRAMKQVARNDHEKPYDLLHIHSVPDLMVFSALVPRLRGTPVILDIHDILPELYASKFNAGENSPLFRAMVGIERISTRFASHVIIANDLWRERLISRGLAPDKCTVLLNSPDRSVFTRSSKPEPIGDKFKILYPGSINWHQGLDLAIQAFAIISEQIPQAEFHIHGEGPQKMELVKLIQRLGMERRIFINPMLPLSDMPKVMEGANLGVVPKRKDNFGNEAFSTKILEFMAMGVPVVVADTTIDKYYFDDSVVKFFSGGNPSDLANKMLEIIQNPAARLQQIENASRFVEKIDWDVKQHEYLALVDRLIGAKKH
jgi:glycosyltransferase involved in cell wall biosynthesis